MKTHLMRTKIGKSNKYTEIIAFVCLASKTFWTKPEENTRLKM